MWLRSEAVRQHRHGGLAGEKRIQEVGGRTLEPEPVIRPMKMEDYGPAIRIIMVGNPVESFAVDRGAPRDEAFLLRIQGIWDRYPRVREGSQYVDTFLELLEEVETRAEAVRNGNPDVLVEVSGTESLREYLVVGRQTPAQLILYPCPVDTHPGLGIQLDHPGEFFDEVLPHPLRCAHRVLPLLPW